MAMKRIPLVLLAAIVLLLCSLGAAAADDYRTIETSPPQDVVNGMATKAGRGLSNMALGWLEIPKQIYVTSKEDGAAKGALIGPFKGIGMTLVRTIVGVAEFTTFFVSSPGFYDPYFDPAYVWQRE